MCDVGKVVKKIKKKKLKSEYFDDFVHQTASKNASKINNGGLESQMAYLIENGWSESQIERLYN